MLFWSTAPVGGMVCDLARGHSGQFGKLIHPTPAGLVKFTSSAHLLGVLIYNFPVLRGRYNLGKIRLRACMWHGPAKIIWEEISWTVGLS